MISSGSKLWDLNAFMGDRQIETIINLDDISLSPVYTEDYSFTTEEIHDEQNSLSRIGQTQRLVIERTGELYILIGPLLPYLALQANGTSTAACICRDGDIPQVQQVLSIALNSAYTRLSPLVYARLIKRLQRLYPVIKSLTGLKPGVKRSWIAELLGISPSAVIRYDYINKVPEALQLRCNQLDFPYLCLKECKDFTNSQFHKLLEDLIHYELHSRYQQISASELSAMIHKIAMHSSQTISNSSEDVTTTVNSLNDDPSQIVDYSGSNALFHANSIHQMQALYDSFTEQYYQNLISAYEDRFDEDSAAGNGSDLMRIAHKDGYMIPDDLLREISYQLYCLSHVRLAGGQRLLNLACLRSISDSVAQIYDALN